MGTWLLADLDKIIYDFMEQLRTATHQGWHRTKPAHYRAILAALESALKERRATSVASMTPDRRAVAITKDEVAALPLAVRWSLLRPLLCLVPSRSQ